MAEGSDEIRVPFSVQIRLPPRDKPGMPHRRRMVNHPAQGWQPGKALAPAGPPSSALPAPAKAVAPTSTDPAREDKTLETDAEAGFVVVLPNGSTVTDALSPTGKLMAPVSDLQPVAAAERRAKLNFEVMLENPATAGGAFWGLASELGVNLGHAGRFDFQRNGNFFAGYKHFNQFVEVSSFNVGLFC